MRPKKVILCVDDNEQELSVLKFMLATNGYRVVSAVTGQEAIGIFAETPVDLVLADFAAYAKAQELVDQLYLQEDAWSRTAVINCLSMGYFSSDRSIREYAERIWAVKPVT